MTSKLILMAVGLILLTGLAIGGFDPSGQVAAVNLTNDSLDSLGLNLGSNGGSGGAAALDSSVSSPVPQLTATGPGDNMATYTSAMPSQDSIGRLLSVDDQSSLTGSVYYDGSYLPWDRFTAVFPSTSPGLWIAGSYGWSWYAVMPYGSWASELVYVPYASYLSMYEFYPGGYVRRYDMGYVQPGYYNIWYYADAPGRHYCQFSLGNSYSNTVVIDVYTMPQPIGPTPRELCEQNPRCRWVNEKCDCVPQPAPNPVAECEAKGCDWYDGDCHCDGPAPNPVAECEARGCQWYDGDCHCDMPGPVPNPVAECEKNPLCHWVDGQCLCTGAGSSAPSSDSQGSNTSLSDSS